MNFQLYVSQSLYKCYQKYNNTTRQISLFALYNNKNNNNKTENMLRKMKVHSTITSQAIVIQEWGHLSVSWSLWYLCTSTKGLKILHAS